MYRNFYLYGTDILIEVSPVIDFRLGVCKESVGLQRRIKKIHCWRCFYTYIDFSMHVFTSNFIEGFLAAKCQKTCLLWNNS